MADDTFRPIALHHVTGISGSAQTNVDFYAGTLGLRLVKKTVNFDDPSTYHLYYGDRVGSPGGAVTFFPWEGVPPARIGAGQATLTSYSAPVGSLDFWERRLSDAGARLLARETVFGEERVVALDPDGAPIAIVAVADDPRAGSAQLWAEAVPADKALRGFHGVTLTLAEAGPTAAILTDAFGYRRSAEVEGPNGLGRVLRFQGAAAAGVIDIHEAPGVAAGRDGAGATHHIAFSAPDRAAQRAVRDRLAAAGHRVTTQIDRDYFWAIYFRTPGGVLFEVATDEPGFTRDEPEAELGQSLKLPTQHEPHRARIERLLPPIAAPSAVETAS